MVNAPEAQRSPGRMTHIWTQQAAIGFVAPPAPSHYHATELKVARASLGRRPTTKPYGKNRQQPAQVLGGGIGVALRCNRKSSSSGSNISNRNVISNSDVQQQPPLTATPSDTGNKTGPPTADSCVIPSFSAYSTTATSRADYLWKATTGALLVVATGTTGVGAGARSASAVGDGGAIDRFDEERKALHVRAVFKLSSASPRYYERNTQ